MEVASLLPIPFLKVQQDVQSQSVFEGVNLNADAVIVGPVRCGVGVFGFKTDAPVLCLRSLWRRYFEERHYGGAELKSERWTPFF